MAPDATGQFDPRYGEASATAPAFAFCTGPDEQMARNLAANARVAVTTGGTGANGWASSKDVVLEGTAIRVSDAETLQALADAWFAKYGEDRRLEVRGAEFVELSHSGGSSASGAWVFRVAADKARAFGDEHGQTAYRF
jgi:hypothetical protein